MGMVKVVLPNLVVQLILLLHLGFEICARGTILVMILMKHSLFSKPWYQKANLQYMFLSIMILELLLCSVRYRQVNGIISGVLEVC